MESWISGAMLIEATILSFLVAFWVTWMSLRGLFRMLPAARLSAVPIRSAGERAAGAIGHPAT
jgi:hypothetical protein